MRSATRSHEKRSASDEPATSTAIQSTPEPAKPSSFWLARRAQSRARRRRCRPRPGLPTGRAASIRARRWRPAAAPGRAHRPRRQGRARHVGRRAAAGAHRAGQRAEPGPRADQHRPPDRVAADEEGEIGQPGAEHAGAVLNRAAGAGGREARVGRAVRRQRQHRDQPDDGADKKDELLAPMRRGAGDGLRDGAGSTPSPRSEPRGKSSPHCRRAMRRIGRRAACAGPARAETLSPSAAP